MPEELPDPLAHAWYRDHTYRSRAEDPAQLGGTKRATGMRISVCLPALNEAATVGAICRIVRDRLMGPEGLVDELLVIDSGSTDGTADIAASAGATVIGLDPAREQVGPTASGKGAALWSSLASATGDIVVWLDSDTKNFGEHFVSRLVAPFFRDPSLKLVKAYYERPIGEGDLFSAAGGGRVTELLVRPMINLFYPALAGVIQPLAGECAVRRNALMEIPFMAGYGVDVAILIDVVAKWGLDALAQADLGVRMHRNRDLMELGRMSFDIIRTMVGRFEDLGLMKAAGTPDPALVQFLENEPHLSNPAQLVELPPLASVLTR
jgi:glucosyl-3-phosphoglycerate synthase